MERTDRPGLILVVLGIGGVMLNGMLKQSVPGGGRDRPGGAEPADVSPATLPPNAGPIRATPPFSSRGARTQPTLRLAESAPQSGRQTSSPSLEEPSDLGPQPARKAPPTTSGRIGGQKAADFVEAAAAVRADLAARDLTAARTEIETASAAAHTPAESDELDRLETMLDHLTQFWDGIRAAMARLQPGEEIMPGKTPLIVVKSDKDYLKVKTGGRLPGVSGGNAAHAPGFADRPPVLRQGSGLEGGHRHLPGG